MSLFDEFLDLVTIYDRIPYWQIMVPILADVLITVSQWVLRTALMHTSFVLQWSIFLCQEFFPMEDWPPWQTPCTMTNICDRQDWPFCAGCFSWSYSIPTLTDHSNNTDRWTDHSTNIDRHWLIPWVHLLRADVPVPVPILCLVQLPVTTLSRQDSFLILGQRGPTMESRDKQVRINSFRFKLRCRWILHWHCRWIYWIQWILQKQWCIN